MADGDLVHQLKILAELRAAGMITEEEFGRAKAGVLGAPTSQSAGYAAVQNDTPAAPNPAADDTSPPGLTVRRPTPPGRAAAVVPSARPHRPTAYIITGGGLLTFLAFFAMPFISVPIFGSLTGAGVAELSSQVGALAWLWLVPLGAIVISGIGAWQSLARELLVQQRRRTSIVVVVAAAVVFLIYMFTLIALENAMSNNAASGVGVSASTFTGVGFWIALIAVIAAGVAAILDLKTARED